MKRYIGTCLPHAGRYMQSRTGAVTQVSILPQSFFCYCRMTFLLLPHHFFAAVLFFAIAASLFLLLRHHFFAIAASFFANCNEKIAAPRRTRVTNATKICRTSLVARYAAPPCVTRYAATYIASTVALLIDSGSTCTYVHLYCLLLHVYCCTLHPSSKSI